MNLKTFLGVKMKEEIQVILCPCSKEVVEDESFVPDLIKIQEVCNRQLPDGVEETPVTIEQVKKYARCSKCADLARQRGIAMHRISATKWKISQRDEILNKEQEADRLRSESMRSFVELFAPTPHRRDEFRPKVIGRIGEPAVAVDPKFMPATKRGRRRKDDAA